MKFFKKKQKIENQPLIVTQKGIDAVEEYERIEKEVIEDVADIIINKIKVVSGDNIQNWTEEYLIERIMENII